MTGPKVFARIDLVVAICLAALSLLLIYAADRAAADAVRRYGHNVDSGALEWMAAVLYVAPLALLFGFASLALSRRWWIGRFAHWLAVAAVVALPFVDYVSIF
jgi:cell division protein FtsW (lipid II flippase)